MANAAQIVAAFRDVAATKSLSDEEMTDRLLFDVPRRGMKFIDLPYQSDQNLKAAFRHEIGVPNHIWPENWKDLKETTDHT